MVDVQSVFKKFSINPKGSINRTIQSVSDKISEASDPLVYSNRIISMLGGVANVDTREAPIIAKCLIEQAVLMNDNYDPVAAQAIAEQKLERIKVNMPYIFKKENSVEAATHSSSTARPAGSKRGADKKAKALAIFEANRDKKPSDVAKLIQVELGISFANAYYYVSRVFK